MGQCATVQSGRLARACRPKHGAVLRGDSIWRIAHGINPGDAMAAATA
jgi:hypothetical protein